MAGAYKTRFAPSPTGKLHLGHARTALVAWLRARSVGGRIVMRIEDLDPPRIVDGATEAILEDHLWLGLDWDEGPLRQSDRAPAYEAALRVLEGDGHLYPCTCSRKEIAEIASAPHGPDGVVYPGTCRGGPSHPDRPASLRFRMEGIAPAFVDALMGPQPAGMVEGDFVVRRADGLFAYHLAVVVDDAAAGVTEVVRGADLLPSTPRHLALYRALGLAAPAHLHVPLVLGADGERLAKRNGALPVAAHRAAGARPEQVIGVLAHSLGLRPDARPVAARELVGDFDLARIPREPVRIDPATLPLPAEPPA